MESLEAPLWRRGPVLCRSWGQVSWTRWSPVNRHTHAQMQYGCITQGGAWYQGWTDVLKQENRGLLREEKRRGEGCNYTSLERGRLICSPLTLSLLFPDSDQRQTCMYLSRHAPLGTDGALQCPAWNYSAFSSAEVKLQSTLPCVVLIHSHNGPFLWVCRYQPGVIIPQRFAIEKDRPLLIVDSFMLNRLGKLKGKCCFSWTDE